MCCANRRRRICDAYRVKWSTASVETLLLMSRRSAKVSERLTVLLRYRLLTISTATVWTCREPKRESKARQHSIGQSGSVQNAEHRHYYRVGPGAGDNATGKALAHTHPCRRQMPQSCKHGMISSNPICTAVPSVSCHHQISIAQAVLTHTAALSCMLRVQAEHASRWAAGVNRVALPCA